MYVLLISGLAGVAPKTVEWNRWLTMSQTISAHFDGQHILLDEAVELEPNTKLLVTVLPKDVESEEWRGLSAKRLVEAYADDEQEYPVDLVKESNPEYESK